MDKQNINQLIDDLKNITVQALDCAEKKDIGRLTVFISKRASLIEQITANGLPEVNRSGYLDMLDELLLIDKQMAEHISQDMEKTSQNIQQAVKQKKLSRRFHKYSGEHAMIVNQTV